MENRIQKDLVAAMKAKDAVRLASLRSIKTAITVAKTAPNAPETLSDGDIQKIIQKLVKQRKDSAEQYTAAGRQELADNELAEMAIMEDYLPKQLTVEDMYAIIGTQKNIAGIHGTPFNIGVIMKYFKDNYSGQYDGKTLSTIAKEMIG